MMLTASRSISRRTGSDVGKTLPVMCSFKFSPVPRPGSNRPGIRVAAVAAACATIAGW